VFLGRRPNEPADHDMQDFYTKLLQAINRSVFREGKWSLCARTGWADNPTFQNLVAWNWLKNDERYLIVVNLSDCPAQARVQISWSDLCGANWRLIDLLSGVTYERSGDEMLSPGLYVELRPWDYHFFQCCRIGKDRDDQDRGRSR
jgi:hypothetical protein